MPTYNFKCLTCDYHFEKFQKMNDGPPLCDKCGSSKTTKAPTAPLGVKGGYMDTSVRASRGVKV